MSVSNSKQSQDLPSYTSTHLLQPPRLPQTSTSSSLEITNTYDFILDVVEPNPPTNEPVDVMGFIKGLEEFPVSKLKQTNAGMQEKDPFVGLPYDDAKEVYCEGMNALVCSRFKSFDYANDALKLVYRRSFVGSSVTNKERQERKSRACAQM